MPIQPYQSNQPTESIGWKFIHNTTQIEYTVGGHILNML